MKFFLRRHWRSSIWAIFILIVCLLPSDDFQKIKFINIPFLDKYVHFTLYFIFSLLLISENNRLKHRGSVTMTAMVIAALISIFYGGFIELLQLFLTSTRSAELSDFILNFFGFVVAAISYRWINRVTEGII